MRSKKRERVFHLAWKRFLRVAKIDCSSLSRKYVYSSILFSYVQFWRWLQNL